MIFATSMATCRDFLACHFVDDRVPCACKMIILQYLLISFIPLIEKNPIKSYIISIWFSHHIPIYRHYPKEYGPFWKHSYCNHPSSGIPASGEASSLWFWQMCWGSSPQPWISKQRNPQVDKWFTVYTLMYHDFNEIAFFTFLSFVGSLY